jgi:hypothetical protein
MSERRILKVRLRNPSGDYLSACGGQWEFDPDVRKAVVFDYLEDYLDQQLSMLERTQGIVLRPVPLPPWEVYESCDRCDCLLTPMEAYFDGEHFLCAACRRPGPARAAN